MTSTESFDGYVRGNLSLFKSVMENGHQITYLALRTALVHCLPKEWSLVRRAFKRTFYGSPSLDHRVISGSCTWEALQ
jgi:hypothetical protein